MPTSLVELPRRLTICTQAMIDAEKRLVEATLEAKRAAGEDKLVFAFVYDSSRFISHLDCDEKIRRCFKKRGSDGSVVDAVHDVELSLAGQGVRSIDARGDHRGLADRLVDTMSRDDRALIGASSVAFVPGGTVFQTTVAACSFPYQVEILARRGLVLSDAAIAFLEDNPHLWYDLLNSALDPFRPFTPRNEDARKKLMELGDAARQGVPGGELVKFNVAASFRTVAAVAAAAQARSSVEINR